MPGQPGLPFAVPCPPAVPVSQRRAAERASAVTLARDRIAAGEPAPGAIRAAAASTGHSEAAVRNWLRRALEAEAAGKAAAAALADRPRPGRPPTIWLQAGAEDAWRYWSALYGRLEAPSAVGCWRRVLEAARARGWDIPGVKAFLRRQQRDVDPLQAVRDREGRIAVVEAQPHQVRTVAGLRPLDWVNGDGHRHNLFVIPPDGGDPIRPITWAWQDVRTRRILAHRSGLTESADLVRLAFHDLVTEHGVPHHACMDNTRAASAKWLAGNSNRRWRSDGEHPPGILQLLGVKVHRTIVDYTAAGKGRGRGRSKPVERAFRDWDDEIDKHPLAAGAYTGRSIAAKPENHGGRTLEWDEFLAILADGVARLNARPGRRTEAANGRSFDETWEAETASTPVRRLPPEQAAILLMAVESAKVQRSGVFTVKAGSGAGVPRNQYYHPDLIEWAGKHVVARFDPDELHAGVEVFDPAGKWLCRAECRLPVAFNNMAAAGEQARLHRTRLRHLERANQAADRLDQLLEQYGVTKPPRRRAATSRKAKVVRMTPVDAKRPDVARRRELEAKRARGLKQFTREGGGHGRS